jgi:predicted ester cyclase
MSEANKTLVRRYYAEATSGLKNIEEVVSANFVDHHFPPGLPPGPAGVREFFLKLIAAAFSDLEIQHESMLAEGDKVDCHFTVVARHTGEFAGLKPKGNILRLPAISTFRVENGRLAEAWEIFDSGLMLQQLRAGDVPARGNAEFYDASGAFDQEKAKRAYLDFLQQAGYPLNDAITAKIWVSDFGLGRFAETGLGGIIWWGDEKHNFTGLDAFLLPGQMIPEHWHVAVRNIPAKMEAWLVRYGEIYACAEGEPTPSRKAKLVAADAANVTVQRERILGVGDIAGIARPLEKHWMQAGPQGAIFTEFSTFHTGEAVRFTDPKIKF